MRTKLESIDEYLATVSQSQRQTLERLRQTIRKLAPEVVECISYSMPAFRFQGKVVAGFLARQAGCSYYPFSGTTLATLSEELVGYERTKSALHFDTSRPLPVTLVRKLLYARIGESAGKARNKKRDGKSDEKPATPKTRPAAKASHQRKRATLR